MAAPPGFCASWTVEFRTRRNGERNWIDTLVSDASQLWAWGQAVILCPKEFGDHNASLDEELRTWLSSKLGTPCMDS